jgi:hypothetical protein
MKTIATVARIVKPSRATTPRAIDPAICNTVSSMGYSLLASRASGMADTARVIEFKVIAATTKATAAMAVQEMD